MQKIFKMSLTDKFRLAQIISAVLLAVVNRSGCPQKNNKIEAAEQGVEQQMVLGFLEGAQKIIG